MTTDLQPPADDQAEKDTLGALILDRDAVIQVADFLRPDDFRLDRHGIIYAAILDLYKRREPPDASTLASELARVGKLKHVGGISYLMEMATGCPTAVHVEYYARSVQRCSVLRRLITAGGEIAGIGYDTALQADEAINKAQQVIVRVATQESGESGAGMEQSMGEFLDFLDAVGENHTGVTGIPTGLTDLDAKTGGLQRGDLIIIAGRPGTGKTTATQNIGLNVAKQGLQVAMYELEMTRAQLSMRAVAREAQIDFQQLRTGKLNSEQLMRASAVAADLSLLPFFVDDSVPLNIMQLGVKAHKRKAMGGLDLLIVDYLQLVRSTKKGVSREQEVAEVSQELKILAKSLNIPVIANAQLNRAVEHRPDGKAKLSDLRESGQVENDADIVIFIHKDENGPQSVAEFDIAKHRNGPLGSVAVFYDAATMTFDDLGRR